jgi:hypothetical protein
MDFQKGKISNVFFDKQQACGLKALKEIVDFRPNIPLPKCLIFGTAKQIPKKFISIPKILNAFL